ncbi:MAG: hypothetical protein WBW44_08290 [Solirubrobacterales bacterium]
MDFKKLGQQVGQLQKSAKEKLGDRAEPENLKKDAKEFREILAGDGSLADKAKEAKQRLDEQPKERSRKSKGPAADEPSGKQGSSGQSNVGGNEPGSAP